MGVGLEITSFIVALFSLFLCVLGLLIYAGALPSQDVPTGLNTPTATMILIASGIVGLVIACILMAFAFE